MGETIPRRYLGRWDGGRRGAIWPAPSSSFENKMASFVVRVVGHDAKGILSFVSSQPGSHRPSLLQHLAYIRLANVVAIMN